MSEEPHQHRRDPQPALPLLLIGATDSTLIHRAPARERGDWQAMRQAGNLGQAAMAALVPRSPANPSEPTRAEPHRRFDAAVFGTVGVVSVSLRQPVDHQAAHFPDMPGEQAMTAL